MHFIKKCLFASIIFLIISNNLVSQDSFGIYLGGGACKEGNSLVTTYFKPGFEAGATYKIDFRKHLGFRIMAGYKLRGFKDRAMELSGVSGEPGIVNYHLVTFGPDMIIPLVNEKSKIYFLAGVRGNLLLAASGSFAEDAVDLDEYTEMLDKIQLEALGGIGWAFLDGIFIEGIVSGNCLNKGNRNTESDFRAYDLYFGISVGYTFQKRSSTGKAL
jgi:hypothetical protein